MLGSHLESGVLVGEAGLIEELLLFHHLLLGGFEDGVQSAQDRHGQDDIAVLAAYVKVSQNVVGNGPKKVGDAVELGVLHCLVSRSHRG